RPDDQALAPACARPRGAHPQADLSHHREAPAGRRDAARAGGSGNGGEAEAREARSREEEGGGRLMGHKVHPGGMRVGVIHDWKSNWYTSKKEFPAYLLEDIRIREHIYRKLSHAGLSDINIKKD